MKVFEARLPDAHQRQDSGEGGNMLTLFPVHDRFQLLRLRAVVNVLCDVPERDLFGVRLPRLPFDCALN